MFGLLSLIIEIHQKELAMPQLKTRTIFISHAWHRDEHYKFIVDCFNNADNFSWKDCSVPSHDNCDETSNAGLKRCLTRQITPAQCVIIIAGMYAAYSEWIDYEIDEAVRMGKVIIGVRPRGQERVPSKIQEAAAEMVNWNCASIVDAVRRLV